MIHALVGVERNLRNVMGDKLQVKGQKLKVNSETSETIYSVPGFKAGGVSSGIKSDGVKDLALIYSEVPSTVAGVFTTNVSKLLIFHLTKIRFRMVWHKPLL